MKKNTASQVVGAQMVTAADGTAFTGSVTVYVTGDGGTQAVGSVSSGACTHEGNGYHTYAPAQAETNYDMVAFTFIGTGAIPATVQVYTTFPQTGDSYARLGAPAGVSVSDDLATIDSNVDAILTDTADMQPKLGTPAGASLAEDLATIDTVVDAILADTGTDGVVVDWSAIVNPTATKTFSNTTVAVTSAVAGNVGGNVVGSVGSLATQAKADVNAEVDSALDTAIPGTPTAGSVLDVLKDLDALLPGSGTLSTLDAAAINAEVVDALATDTYAEAGSIPAATVSLAAKIGFLYMLARNKMTQTATTTTLRNDADSGNVGTSTVSDDGTTFTRGEWS